MGIGEYKLWTPLDGENILIVGNSGGLASSRAAARGHHACTDWRTLRQALSYSTRRGIGRDVDDGVSSSSTPVVETEGVAQVLSMTTELAANAAPLRSRS